MTNSPTSSVPNTTSRVNHFTGLARRRRKFSLLPANGDGSTLSLDFTTGVLDPRLTFTRSTNATFINSNGLVQYADANLLAYSETMAASPWAVNGITNTYAAVANPFGVEDSRLLTVAASGGSKSLAAQMTIAQGFQYTFRIWVRAGTSSSVSIGYYLTTFQNCTMTKVSGDGTVSGSGTGALYQTVTGLTNNWTLLQVTLATTTTAGSGQWYIYPNTPSPQSVGNSIYVWGAQCNIGATANPYYTTTTSAYQAPRFDYDPTAIGTPRGLLIEGSAVNLAPYSNLQSAWAGGTNTTLTPNTTEVLSPDGTNNAAKVALTNSGYCSRFESITGLAASTAYTFSYWIRGTAGNQQRVYSVTAGADLVTQTTRSYSTSGWTRVQINFTTTAAVSNVYIYVVSRPTGTASDVMYIWGVQLETGTGASSLIPTGASTGNRATDVCTIGVDAGTATNFSSWWPLNQSQFTVAWTGDLVRNTSAVQFLWLTRNSVNTSIMRVFANSTSGQPLLGFAGNSIPTSVAVNGIPGATLKTALAAQEGDQAFYANNGTVSSSGVAATTGLAFTSVSMNFNPNADQFMHIKSFKFWPTRLPNAQLQALTT